LLKVKMVVQTQDREYGKTGALSQYQMPEKIEYNIDVQPYLKATDHIKIDGIVKFEKKKNDKSFVSVIPFQA